jgi:hypothetical protein
MHGVQFPSKFQVYTEWFLGRLYGDNTVELEADCE